MKFKRIINILLILVVLCFSSINTYAHKSDAKLIEEGYSYLGKVDSAENPELDAVYLKKAQYCFYVVSKREHPPIDALLGLGIVYLKKGKYHDARNIFTQAYSTNPNDTYTNFYMGELNYVTQNYNAALNFFIKSRKNGYKETELLNRKIASCYEKLGDLDRAMDIYDNINSADAKAKLEELRAAKTEQIEKSESGK